MPTTLDTLKGFGDIAFCPGALKLRPALAQSVMQVIELWSFAEAQTLWIGREILGGNAMVATTLIQAVENQTAQRAMVMAGVKHLISKDDGLLFDATVASIGPSRKVRHRFSHHYWGLADGLPDALLLQDPRDQHREVAERIQLRSRGPTESDLSTIFVWVEKDLLAEVTAAERADTMMSSLYRFIYHHLRGNQSEVDSTRQALFQDKDVEQRFQLLKKQTPQRPLP